MTIIIMPYVVKVSSAKMPRGVIAPYCHIAVIETLDGQVPKMISARARGVIRIVRCAGPCHRGFRPRGRTEAERTLAEFRAIATALNSDAWGAPCNG